MAALTQHFLVDNGDMALFELESGRKILIDINIREKDDKKPDVLSQLREVLERDDENRLFVDAMLVTHPDEDHCRGLEEHFHLGDLNDWSESDDKIVIREMWSSPIVFRRASKTLTLCDDAKAWSREAKRRVAVYEARGVLSAGDCIQILGEDADGKTDELDGILVKIDDTITTIAGDVDGSFQALLLGPLSASDDDDEDVLSKNNSSVILQMSIHADGVDDAGKYLMGGDAEVAIWEKMWAKHCADPSVLEFDVLISPHHCSWHSLSHDSWSKKGEKSVVSADARSALSQALAGARIIASSNTIVDDANDPPCIRAKREYAEIITAPEIDGEFRCIADEPGDGPFKMEVTKNGPRPKRIEAAALAGSGAVLGTEVVGHG